jgi:epsilon-lactone hydrolase
MGAGLARFALAAVVCALSPNQQAAGQPGSIGTREVPSRTIAVPDTVSPQMQALIAKPPVPFVTPQNAAEWKALAEKMAGVIAASLPKIRDTLGVTVVPDTIRGVKVFIVTPKAIPPSNRDRVLLYFHGGGFLLNPGEAGTREAILLAGFGGFKVISVDYRMLPDFPYPAALDDAMTVYRSVLEAVKARNVGIFGTSSGGGMTLAMVLRAKSEHVPLPGAIAPGTPASDLTKTGDTFFTNEMIDNVLVTYDALAGPAALLYANGHDLKDPLLSPIYGDVHDFPPTILTSGTRDLFLSLTVRMHRKLRAAGVEAVLQVWEGQSHAQYNRDPDAPETKEYNEEIARFFDRHLGR